MIWPELNILFLNKDSSSHKCALEWEALSQIAYQNSALPVFYYCKGTGQDDQIYLDSQVCMLSMIDLNIIVQERAK